MNNKTKTKKEIVADMINQLGNEWSISKYKVGTITNNNFIISVNDNSHDGDPEYTFCYFGDSKEYYATSWDLKEGINDIYNQIHREYEKYKYDVNLVSLLMAKN